MTSCAESQSEPSSEAHSTETESEFTFTNSDVLESHGVQYQVQYAQRVFLNIHQYTRYSRDVELFKCIFTFRFRAADDGHVVPKVNAKERRSVREFILGESSTHPALKPNIDELVMKTPNSLQRTDDRRRSKKNRNIIFNHHHLSTSINTR